jgi:glycosyltransferase involved in cell wall biosynthesis
VSETIRDTLARLGASDARRLHVIPNGVELLGSQDGHRVAADVRTVIFTGNLAPYQGVDLLLEAFGLLRARRPGARLLIATDSSFDPYEALARRLGVRDAIELHRAAFPEQSALMGTAAVAVNPRVQCDGIPQKLLNYMAAGMPIATFDGSAGPIRHEVTGLRVRDGDTAAMAAAIERLLADRELAQRLGGAAREQARRDFSWARVAARVEDVYRAALAEGR